jgi:hypothetical protein
VGSRASLDAVEKKKILDPAVNWTPAFQPVVSHTINWDIIIIYKSLHSDFIIS